MFAQHTAHGAPNYPPLWLTGTVLSLPFSIVVINCSGMYNSAESSPDFPGTITFTADDFAVVIVDVKDSL